MQVFLDTANFEEIKTAIELGVISGVTTNPSLVAKEKGRSFYELVAEIARIVPGPVSAEALGTTAPEMVKEARELAAIRGNVVVKIPVTAEGLKAVHQLHAEGIKTNVTLIFSVNQAILAARAGAAFVSPFIGRLDDIGFDGVRLVKDIIDIFRTYQVAARVIAASVRHPLHVCQAAQAGADIATIPYKVLMQMMEHPLTAAGIEKFQADWQKFSAGNKSRPAGGD